MSFVSLDFERIKMLINDLSIARIIKSTLQMHAEFGKDFEIIRNAQQDVANTGNIVNMQRKTFLPRINSSS